MAKQDSLSFTQRLGGNRTIVLGIVILMLILFTVDLYVVPALGGGGSRAEDYVRFTVNGKQTTITFEKYTSDLADWQRFQSGQSRLTGRPLAAASDEFLQDLMVAGLARGAGLSIPDDSVREFIRTHPLFQDGNGDFDPAAFAKYRKEIYGDLPEKAFEKEARRHLLVDHYTKIYANAFLAVGDAECFQRWKAAHPKVEITFAWQPVASLREGMKEADLPAGEIDTYWKDPAVQNRHKTLDRRSFQAVAVRVDGCDDAAYVRAREERKDDKDLEVTEPEGFTFWTAWRQYDFNLGNVDEDGIKALRAQNEARVRAEDEEARKAAELKKKEEAPKDPPKDPPKEGEAAEEKAPPVDPYSLPPLDLDAREQYRLYWQFRVEKEVWLRKYMDKVRREMTAGNLPAKAALEAFDRPGLGLSAFDQAEPVDQYQVEKIEGLGLPNCPLRYSLNEYKADRAGKVHDEVIQRTASTAVLAERGWVVFRFTGIEPAVIPSLDAVREAVVKELLDRKARDEARTRLSRLRKTAEDARSTLKDAAAGAGYETAAVGPFNEFTWRPPWAKDALKDEASRAAAWSSPDTRLASVMSKYFTFRDVPVGAFSEVVDDVEATGAMYLVQVNARAEPVLEEMTPAQTAAERRAIGRERLMDLGRELSYDGLKDKLSLFVEGEPAKTAEEIRKGRTAE